MNVTCQQCQHGNPDNANYCAACGSPVRNLPRRANCCRSRSSSGAFFLFLVLAGWLVIKGPPAFLVNWTKPLAKVNIGRIWDETTAKLFKSNETLQLTLQGDRATEVYTMLAPKDVRVIVGRNNDRSIFVKGTQSEVRALQNFAAMLNEGARAGADMNLVRNHGTTEAHRYARDQHGMQQMKYTMPKEKMGSLCQLLRKARIGNYVECNDDVLTVVARDDDHQVIERIVCILNGERF